MIGGLAQIFRRCPAVTSALVFYAVGSAISGAAQSMTMPIIGKTVWGVGGGGILTMTESVMADLVPLRDRGFYMGLFGA